MVPSLVILPVKLVLVTQTPGTVCALGLSNVALTLTQAANAGGAPPPTSTAASEVEASHQPSRARRPRLASIIMVQEGSVGAAAGTDVTAESPPNSARDRDAVRLIRIDSATLES